MNIWIYECMNQEADFLHFRNFGQEMRKIRSRKLFFCIFGAQARKCEKYGPGSSSAAFSELRPGKAKNTVQEAHFLHFQRSGQEMRKIRSRKCIFCTFRILVRKCEKNGPGNSFFVFSELRPENVKNAAQEAHFLHFRSSSQEI